MAQARLRTNLGDPLEANLSSNLTQRAKLFIWHIIMNSMYNQARAQKIGHMDGCCSLYLGQQENNEHMFFHYFKAQRGWASTALFYEANPLDNSLVDVRSILDIIDGSLQKTPESTTRLFVIYQTYWELWNQRNDRMYNKNTLHSPIEPLWNWPRSTFQQQPATKTSSSYKKCRRLRKVVELILPSTMVVDLLSME